jgi:hypothetical protein
LTGVGAEPIAESASPRRMVDLRGIAFIVPDVFQAILTVSADGERTLRKFED